MSEIIAKPCTSFFRVLFKALVAPFALLILGGVEWFFAPAEQLLLLAKLGVLLSLTTLLISGLGLHYIRVIAERSIGSRSGLLTGFKLGQKILPVFLILLTLTLPAAIIVHIAYGTLFLAIQEHSHRLAGKPLLIGILFSLAVLLISGKAIWNLSRSVFRRFEPDHISIMGQNIDRAAAPKLWQFVEEVAQRLKCAPPDIIVVGLDENFFVTEHSVQLVNGRLLESGRILYLPLPYMQYLERSEVAAIIGHELAHFTGEDTHYGLKYAPIQRAAQEHLSAIYTNECEDSPPVRWTTMPATLLGEYFLDTFFASVQYWSQLRELEADRISSQVAGNTASASALLRITLLEDRIVPALHQCRKDPAQAKNGILRFVEEQILEKGLNDPTLHMEDRQAHPLDSHPSLRQRLDALGVSLIPALIQRARDTASTSLLFDLGLSGKTRQA